MKWALHRLNGFSFRVTGFCVGCWYDWALSLFNPDVDHVEYLIVYLIAGSHFLIKDFIDVVQSLIEIRLTNRPVHTRLIHLVKGNFVRRVLVVLEPEADALCVHLVFGVESSAPFRYYLRNRTSRRSVRLVLAGTLLLSPCSYPRSPCSRYLSWSHPCTNTSLGTSPCYRLPWNSPSPML
jgi:hypothetical protein